MTRRRRWMIRLLVASFLVVASLIRLRSASDNVVLSLEVQSETTGLLTPQNITLQHLKSDKGWIEQSQPYLTSGERTPPALVGARRAHIDCPHLNVDSLAYWNDPVGIRDLDFVSPFASASGGYISFSPDPGGWNNARMGLESLLVLAAVTNRTLVLPPKTPMYLLQNDPGQRYRGFADFFPLFSESMQRRVKIISFADLVKQEGGPDGKFPLPTSTQRQIHATAETCDRWKQSGSKSCRPVFAYLEQAGVTPRINSAKCLVFDSDLYMDRNATRDHLAFIDSVCGQRGRMAWQQKFQQYPLWHFKSGDGGRYRLLTHFYNFVHFTEPVLANYYKRMVRDVLHYHDSIYCAAGKIVKALQAESRSRGQMMLPASSSQHNSDQGFYSSLHVRRGDLQYKRVKISSQEWYNNTMEVWEPGEILYVATDERNKTFFDNLARHHTLRFLEDYWDLAGLDAMDRNHMGMIDSIVASYGRTFTGTWFSSFSGYINRLRGYHGKSMKDSWYSFLPKKRAMHQWPNMTKAAWAFEWPDGWIGIDEDVWPSKDVF